MALNQIISEGIKDGEVKGVDIATDAVGITDLSATGTASNTTFLRGDNAWATPPDTNTQLTEEQVEDFVGGMVTGNTETGITVTYEDSDGTLDFVVAPEGDTVKSTTNSNETSGKVLTADGDGTCSWQTAAGGATRDATGTRNIAGPTTAGDALEAGAQDNTLYGYDAGTALTTGDNNLAVGAYSLIGATTSSQNTALGSNCMTAAVTGADNVAVGFFALKDNTSGANNVAIGRSALQVNTTGGLNVAIGRNAMAANTDAVANVAVGYAAAAANETGASFVAVGYGALNAQTTANFNVAIGRDALALTTTSGAHTAVGYKAGTALTSGTQFTAIGYEAGKTNSTAGYMTAVGYQACKNADGTSGNANELTGIGAGALNSNTTGQYNTALGSYALSTCTDGSSNVAIGKSAGYDLNSTGNILIGTWAGDEITSGNFNICLGYEAGSNTTNLTTGNKNLLLGAYCHTSSDSGENQVVMGYNVVGKGDHTLFCNQNPYNLGNSSSWNTTSDRRIKKNIVDNTVGLDAVNQIRVRNFEYRTYDEITELDNPAAAVVTKEGVQIGCIAQELETVLPSAVNTNEDNVKNVDNDPIIWALVNSVKELSAKNDALEARLATLESA